MTKILAVTSGKGGSGKSTFSIQISLANSVPGKRVLLIDMDEGMRCLDMLLGVSEQLVFDLGDAVSGRDLDTCLLTPKNYSNISLLAAPRSKGEVLPEAFGKFIRDISSEKFDLVVVDLPAGSDPALYAAFPVGTEFICICNPNPVSVRDAANIGALLHGIDRRGYLVINRYDRYFVKNPVFDHLDDIIDQTGLTLLGIVPESEKIGFAFLTGKFPTRGREFRAFARIASRLDGKNVSLPRLKKI
ncbi:MAG: P-loop NTPase [Clostridia bacterium]|nr:P-loop NTPase [Clostridia bacterium]